MLNNYDMKIMALHCVLKHHELSPRRTEEAELLEWTKGVIEEAVEIESVLKLYLGSTIPIEADDLKRIQLFSNLKE